MRKGGVIIFKAFSKTHIDYIAKNEQVGGLKEIEMLFSIDEMKSDFSAYDFDEIPETEIELSEGLFHNGPGSVMRFVRPKK